MTPAAMPAMTHERAIGIVLLAAGAASRFGSAKQLVAIDGEPMARRMARVALSLSPRTAVVTGAHRESVEDALRGLAVDAVFHAGWAAGMGSSLAFGVRHLRQRYEGLDAIVICLADQPAIGAAHLHALTAVAQASPGNIVASAHGQGVQGAPCLFPSRFFDELEALDGAEGARRLLVRHAGDVQAVPMPDARIDIDTPQDCQRWREASAG